LLAIGFGFVALLAVYFLILSPENVQFDSRWKHLALAEDYVAYGGIRPLREGWVFDSRPHFTSYLFSWAFLLPKSRLFDRMVLSAHLEFMTSWSRLWSAFRRSCAASCRAPTRAPCGRFGFCSRRASLR